MTRQEFENLAGVSVSVDDYKVIETVYVWHPCISEVNGKDEIVKLFQWGGMRIMHDMFWAATKTRDLREELEGHLLEVKRLKQDIRDVAKGKYE